MLWAGGDHQLRILNTALWHIKIDVKEQEQKCIPTRGWGTPQPNSLMHSDNKLPHPNSLSRCHQGWRGALWHSTRRRNPNTAEQEYSGDTPEGEKGLAASWQISRKGFYNPPGRYWISIKAHHFVRGNHTLCIFLVFEVLTGSVSCEDWFLYDTLIRRYLTSPSQMLNVTCSIVKSPV